MDTMSTAENSISKRSKIQVPEHTAAEPMMEIPVTTPKALLADKGYNGDRYLESLPIRGILPIIPPPLEPQGS
ncbi:MAG: hypothetical protein H6918_05335 [Sphingomonadaceae bacterium]|nr:hypothetical protein [Sphingomonadaceae bacterium]